LLEKVAFAALQEQRAKRRWGIFFKLAGLSYLVAVLVLVVDWGGSEQLADARHTAVIHLHGTIEAQGEASAQNINDALEELLPTSGRPVSSCGSTARVAARSRQALSMTKFVGCARSTLRFRFTPWSRMSALPAAITWLCRGQDLRRQGEHRRFDRRLDGRFGFTGTMEKLGIERRLLTAGENKGFLDPFSPQDAKQKAHAQVLLREIHEQFIDVVRRGRGDRLKDTPELFSGLMWTGSQSVGLGLADGLGTVGSVARDVIKADRIVEFTIRENIAERFARRLRADSTEGVVGSLLGAGRLRFVDDGDATRSLGLQQENRRSAVDLR
jgi:protease-4